LYLVFYVKFGSDWRLQMLFGGIKELLSKSASLAVNVVVVVFDQVEGVSFIMMIFM